ncbi:hypothetical protein NQ317_011171, partial [Molorchus minor]
EFMILPTGATSFTQAMRMGSEVYHHLKKVIKDKFGLDATAVGDEGGFAPNIQDNKEGLELIKAAIEKAGYTGKIEIGMDVAASEFHKDGQYDLDFKNPNSDKSQWLSPDKLLALYQDFIKNFPIVSIEDPFDQDHWDAWAKMTAETTIQIVGDDLTVTNPKLNQIGSVTESIRAHLLAKANGWGTMVSHRSGETEDTFIADLVVGLSTGQIKTELLVGRSDKIRRRPLSHANKIFPGLYDLDFKNPKSDKSKFLDPDKLLVVYQEFIKNFPIVSIEDPFDQDHFEAWSKMRCATDIQIVGDDLTVTNSKRIKLAIDANACNCLLLKVNQVGERQSGETEDTFIADLVVGLSTGQIKTGAPCRSERLAKYNQLLRIEEALGCEAKFAGRNFRKLGCAE